ncbi:MAG: ATP-dependent DNA ligase [Nitrososphaerota archaeon]
MDFSILADFYEKIESTTKRLEMTDYLVELFKKSDKKIIDKVAYLTLGEIYPPYVGLELGLADKLAIKAISLATGVTEEKIEKEYKKLGDLGKVTEKFISSKKVASLFQEPLTVEKVYENLEEICKATGKGAQEKKINIFAGMLANASPKEARYLARMATGRLRLGIADMTLLDALAIAFAGSKEYREMIERAYNLSADIGYVAKKLAEGGMEAIKKFKITIGKPIKVQLAERLPTIEEILEKMNGKASAEFKYDGMRMQAHIDQKKIILFSRREENITNQFPDVVKALREAIKAKEAIVDGEAVPIDPHTGDFLPFQVVSQRRGRKYELEKMVEEIPVCLFLFDLLYLNGEDYTDKPYLERRKKLKEIVKETDKVKLAEYIVSDDLKEIEKFFLESIQKGGEGLIFKSIAPDSFYEAGKRGFKWIKLKRSYQSKMADTVDLVIVGGFRGRGKRAGTYGALLMAAYNPKMDRFETVCKLGSGFTDEDLENLPKILSPYKIKHRHPRVNALIEPDEWFVPALVLEVIGDEITLSPVHTCAFGSIKEGSGLAIRFPRLVKFREERSPEDATTIDEIIEMYKSQLKKIS